MNALDLQASYVAIVLAAVIAVIYYNLPEDDDDGPRSA